LQEIAISSGTIHFDGRLNDVVKTLIRTMLNSGFTAWRWN
jgi:hypothetical protein